MASNAELDWSQRFAHGILDWALENRITARELAMLRVMNSITNKPGWETKIFDDEVAASWRAEAVARERLMSRRAWAWCVEELRDKAVEFARTGRVAVYDAGPRISKSRRDILGPTGAKLKVLVQSMVDNTDLEDSNWRLDKDDRILNIVDPSLYPLVYGLTKVLPDGEEVSLDNLWQKIDCGPQSVVTPHLLDMKEVLGDNYWPRWSDEKFWRYSNKFQWLPCDVKFQNPDGDDCKLRIESYISNLHPGSHRDLYSVIEDVISASVQPWNDTVTYAVPPRLGRYISGTLRVGLGRASPRIRTFCFQPMYPLPPNGLCIRKEGNFYKQLDDLENDWDTLEPATRNDILRDIVDGLESAEHFSEPNVRQTCWDFREEILDQVEPFIHLEPGIMSSFEEWKSGKVPPSQQASLDDLLAALIPDGPSLVRYEDASHTQTQIDVMEPPVAAPQESGDWVSDQDSPDNGPSPVCPFSPCPVPEECPTMSREDAIEMQSRSTLKEYDHEYRNVELQHTFRRQGLQVFVKIQSIELTPERPRYDGGDWTIEGLFNEHIVATSTYFFDVTNVTDSTAMAFRVHANFTSDLVSRDPECIERKQLISVFAIDDLTRERAIPHTQELGSISISEGAFIAFPSILQYRMGPVELEDASKPGHIRFLSIFLVDPNYRIVSTRRVVPQRLDWWMRDVFPGSYLRNAGIPAELFNQILNEAARESPVITPSQAREFRSRMLRENERMMAEVNSENFYRYFYEETPERFSPSSLRSSIDEL